MDDIPLLAANQAVLDAREKWQYNGQSRPSFAETVGENQESVWDYPRPPIMQQVEQRMTVRHQGKLIADTSQGIRVLETAGAPTCYFPPDNVNMALIKPGDVVSLCEWKGAAQSMLIDGVEVGWRYVQMFPEFSDLYLWVAFYPARIDCFIDVEKVVPQPGGFYGGWVTDNLAGPIKGSADTGHW